MIGAPILLARTITRRYPVSWRTVFAGAVAFVLSQVAHIPFNGAIQPLLPGSDSPYHLAALSVFLGLSAGCFEELARYTAMRWVLTKDRTGPHALAFGAGHGGIESAILGVLVGLNLVNVLVIERVGADHLGLDAAASALAGQQIDLFREAGALPHMLGALERLSTIPFHVAASTLVMRSVVSRRVSWLLVAIAFHAISDGLLIPISTHFGTVVTEAYILATLPASLFTIAVTLRALPRMPRPPIEPRPAASGDPIEVVRAENQYGDVQALGGVSFTLRPGERACLLGPNGAGKTTTIRLITGAIAPTRGFVFVLGQSSEDDGFLEKKRRVGIVPQQPGMYEHLTVRAYLALVRELYDAPSPDDLVAERLGLHEVLDRQTSALSGGMQRRLALAAALLPRPDVLVLDEPSAGLDPVASRQMIACVKEASAGRTTLLCTHNLDEAEDLCDSVIILRAGKVVVHASLEELRSKVLARVALRAHGNPAALADALTARGYTPETAEGEVSVAVTNADRAAPDLLRALLAEGVDVYECRIVRPSLEEIFFAVVENAAATDSNARAPELEGDAS